MSLTDEQQSKVLAHLKETWRQHNCALCGANNWSVNGVVMLGLYGEPQLTGKAVPIGGPSLPCAAVTCGTCGQTILINLVVAGAFDGK